MEKMTQMNNVQEMHITLQKMPRKPSPMKKGPGLNMTSGCFANHRRQKIGRIYERSRAIAQSEKMAPAATGEAKSSSPGRMQTIVVSQTARIGVWVFLLFFPK